MLQEWTILGEGKNRVKPDRWRGWSKGQSPWNSKMCLKRGKRSSVQILLLQENSTESSLDFHPLPGP